MEAADILKQVKVPLFWVGAVTVAWVSVCTLYRLLNGVRVWVLGNGDLIKAFKLGKWAGKQTGELIHYIQYRSHAGI